MWFADRDDAADLLARALAPWRGQHPLVLAVPRGGVPMGRRIAAALDGELDVVLVRKLGAPGMPEFAIGAVDESGWAWLADHARLAGADDAYVARESAAQREVMRRRRARYTPVRPPIDPAGRVAIVVDDGLATGATMLAALHAVRARGPRWLICAVPVASREALALVRPWCDEAVCLSVPDDFAAVGQYYREFDQVDDDRVVPALAMPARPEPEPGSVSDPDANSNSNSNSGSGA